ncbi:MAG: sodium:proton antiporter [Sphingobacteriia bacterium]|nr:sodium:proton antiporter [Sphingobacteriia bacterium]
MSTTIIITICVLLLLAYVFDLSASKTRVPSVILLLALGWMVKQLASFTEVALPDLNPVLPVLGTVGLILIVLEGSLELELNQTKFPLILKSSLIALIPMLAMSLGLAWVFQQYGGYSFKNSLANSIPLAIISSAIAIPSAKNLLATSREFITYESSLSDIFGVIFFNFITLNDNIGSGSVGNFFLELIIILIISFIATIGLAFFLNKIKHPIKYVPIILMVVLIYAISKYYHLPGLIFILLFGLFLGNIDELRRFRFIENLHPVDFNKEVHKFRELTTEIAFLIRALFFLLFGFLIETAELFNTETIVWAAVITASIFIIRGLFLRLFQLPLNPLLYIAPRGLITILLFLSVPLEQQIPLAGKSLIIQVIILTALFMMFGLVKQKKTALQVR